MIKAYSNYTFWWKILAAVVLLLFVSELMEQSMYVDGVWYAAISRNLAEGLGDFWFPAFSETIFSSFHEHPPLLFWLQSFFFQLFGDHWLTERLYSFVQYLLIAVLIVLFWLKTFHSQPKIQQLWFVPLLLWQVNLANYFYLSANLMESPLIIFDLIAIGFLWKVAENRKVLIHLLLASFFLVIAVLTKGFVGLFPLAFLGIYALIFKGSSILKIIGQTSFLVGSIAAFFALLFLVQPQALESLSNYLEVQVMASLKGERRLYYFRESRFFILGQLGISLLPMVGFLLVNKLLSMFFLKKITTTTKEDTTSTYPKKLAAVFFLVGLSASLPIMISPRQALPYLLPSLPFFSLSIGILSVAYLQDWWSVFSEKYKKSKRTMEWGSGLLIFLAIAFCGKKFHQPNKRDAAVISDAQKIRTVVEAETIISADCYDMYISGYLMRYHKISLDTNNLNRTYFLTRKKEGFTNQNELERIPLDLINFELYQRSNRMLGQYSLNK